MTMIDFMRDVLLATVFCNGDQKKTLKSRERATGVLVVLALHGAILYGLWSPRPIPAREATAMVFVHLIDPAPAPLKSQEPHNPPSPIPVKPNQARPPEPRPSQPLMLAEAPAVPTGEALALPPALPALPVQEPGAPPQPAAPISLLAELSLSCPVRTAPVYPLSARRMGEEGSVVLRVELDETGRLVSARVATSSGSSRLDGAALAAVKGWRCNPARRDGQPVRAVAMQPFDFTLTLEGY